jgi:hypothetical protein
MLRFPSARGPNFHAPLEPTDDVLFLDETAGGVEKLGFRQLLVADAVLIEVRSDRLDEYSGPR